MKVNSIVNYPTTFQHTIPKVNAIKSSPLKHDVYSFSKTDKPLISVILPIYNAEKYLKKALKSLQNQTYHNWEAICVNDCSTDSSLDILKDLHKQDDRIKYIEQPKNGGPGIARNTGIEKAQGKYITFLDPDDWLEPSALNELSIQAEKYDTDFIAYNCVIRDEDDRITGEINLSRELPRKCKKKKAEGLSVFRKEDLKDKQFSSLLNVSWNKFYKSQFLKDNADLRFANAYYAEDNPFVIKSIIKSDKIGYLNKSLYNYFVRSNSLSHTTNTRANVMVNLCADIEKSIGDNKNEFLQKNYHKYASKMLNSAYRKLPENLKENFKEQCLEKLQDKNFAQKVVNSLNKTDKKSFKDKVFSINKKDYLGLDKTVLTILGIQITL